MSDPKLREAIAREISQISRYGEATRFAHADRIIVAIEDAGYQIGHRGWIAEQVADLSRKAGFAQAIEKASPHLAVILETVRLTGDGDALTDVADSIADIKKLVRQNFDSSGLRGASKEAHMEKDELLRSLTPPQEGK